MKSAFFPFSQPSNGRQRPRRGPAALLALTLLVLPGFSCRKDQERKDPGPPPGDEQSLRKKIEKLTGGPTKIVWTRDLGSDKDTFANGTQLVLMGLDTRSTTGEKVLAGKTNNYSRPLIAPDGNSVVFSRRLMTGKPATAKWTSEIFSVDWNGAAPRKLRAGYAVDIWRDPSPSGKTWVYALTTLRDGVGANPEGTRMFRFLLTDPDQPEEVIWDQGLLSGDNIQLNRDGTAASGLIPWPNAGTFDFTSGRFVRFRNGCWPSLSPDDSGLVWVFDGTHKNLRMFIPGVDGNWRIPLGESDGVKGKATYHPRWSNHPRILAFTGPHPVNPNEGSGKVSIILGRFNDNMTSIESSLSLRNSSSQPDCYPDVWVADGATASLDLAQAGPKRLRGQAAAAPSVHWEPDPDGLCFVWERANSNNLIPADKRDSGVIPQRYARFGPRFDMLIDGGTFTLDDASTDSVRKAVQSGIWTMEMAITPLLTGNEIPQVIFRAGPELEVQQSRQDFIIHTGGRDWQIGVGLTAGQTTHLALGGAAPGQPPAIWLNGVSQVPRPVEFRPSLPPADTTEVQFGARADGSAAWTGRLETLSFNAHPLDATRVAAHAAWWKEKLTTITTPSRTVVKAVLKEASPRATVNDLGAYARSWTSSLYHKTVLISGPDPGEEFSVAHWTILGTEPITGPPGEPGSERELTLEPMDAHPEIESEHGSEEILPVDQPLPQFLDVASPGS